jgi:hypothetical protein
MTATFATGLRGWKPSGKNKLGWTLVPNFADADDAESIRIAAGVLDALAVMREVNPEVPQAPGGPLEQAVCDHLGEELVCRFSKEMASGMPVTWADAWRLIILSQRLSHRSVIFFRIWRMTPVRQSRHGAGARPSTRVEEDSGFGAAISPSPAPRARRRSPPPGSSTTTGSSTLSARRPSPP